MTLWQATRRATVLIPSGPSHDPDRFHLHVILTDPALDKYGQERVLVVSITSIPGNQTYDASCTLFPGEHPFVVKHSYVLYRKASLVDPGDLEAKVKRGEFVAKPLLSEKVFTYVTEGLIESPYTTPAVLKFFNSINPKPDIS